jgi:hypothetical protein
MPGIRLLFNAGVVDLPTKTTLPISHTHLNNLLEQDITDLLFSPLNLVDIDAILDLEVLTQQTEIRVLEKADGTNFEETSIWLWPNDNDDTTNENLKVALIGHNVDVKVTMKSLVLEGASRTVLGRKAIYTY